MRKMRTTLLLFAVGITGAVMISPCGAADTTADPPPVAANPQAATADLLAAAGDPLGIAAGCPKCTCACSPWLGVWVGCFSEDGKDNAVDGRNTCGQKIIETFKFSLMNLTCDQFVLNLQTSLCEEKVRKAFPETDDVTEFVGVACKSEKDKVVFTAVGYGVKTHDKMCHETVFIAIKSGTITWPCSTGDPNKADVTETIEIFAPEQDTDCDGLPDQCESVICITRIGQLKRILNRPQCEPAKSFVARLEPCKNVQTSATGKAFFKLKQNDDKLSFAVTVKDIKDVTKVVIHVGDAPKQLGEDHKDQEEAIILCPKPPDTECKSGEFSGLLCCGTLTDNDCTGPLKGKKIADLVKAFDEGRAIVIVKTRQNPKGELCGLVEDP
jgi:hypothetical protein